MENKDLEKLKGPYVAKGQYGAVYICKNNINRVIKIVEKCHKIDPLIEVETLKQVKSDFVTKLFYWENNGHNLVMVMETMWGGDLYEFIKRFVMDQELINDFYRQIVLAIRYIHGKNIIHRDIKPENILLTRNRKLKLADFAFSIEFDSEKPFYEIIGSIPYLSPEMISEKGYHKETDIWSSGIVLYEMITGELPFDHPDTNDLMNMICDEEYLEVETNNFLLSKVLEKDPKLRWSVEEILSFV